MDQQPLDASRLDIAIVGMAGRLPGARTIAEFWQNLLASRDSIARFSRDELLARGVPRRCLDDPSFVPAAPVLLDHPGMFDAEFFGFSPREAELLDPQHRLFLECAWEALESAGYDPEAYAGTIGVYASSSLSEYLLFNLLTRPDVADQTEAARAMFGNDKDFVSTRVSYELNLRGPSLTIQTACSSSLVAIHCACQALITNECDMALAGGVSVHVPQRTGYYFVEGGYNPPDGRCRPFDVHAQGTVFGSGVGVVVLKRLDDAVAARDSILAVVRGTAINNDGSGKVGFTAPSVRGQADAIVRAHAMAGVSSSTIEYVETHGTATALGDTVEVSALRTAFAGVTRPRACALGSVKSNIGHLDAAAGVAGFIKAALAVGHGVLPPTLHFEQPNPRLDLAASPFYVSATPAEWPTSGHPRRAGVSSFGIGGTNAHVVLEEPPPAPASASSRPYQLLALSARTPAALQMASARLAEHLREHATTSLPDASFTLIKGRRVFRWRRVVACRDAESAIGALEAENEAPIEADGAERRVAFLFPGGGAQYTMMAAETYRYEAIFREELDRCAAILERPLGIDIRHLLYPSQHDLEPATRQLQRVRFALPVLLAVEHSLSRVWTSWGVTPSSLLGHSLGEYAAALMAGVFSLPDALQIVALRGALLERLPPGAMLSVACPADEIAPLLRDALSIASVNAPGLCVVSGPTDAIDRFAGALGERNTDFRRIHIHASGHSPLVEPILEEFGDRVASLDLRAPTLPYLSCLTGDWIRDDEARSPEYWVRHLRQPVQFSRAAAALLSTPLQVFLEVGPGHGLGSLMKLNATAHDAKTVPTVASLPGANDGHGDDLRTMVAAAGRLWSLGAHVDWDRFFRGQQRSRIPLPTYPFERKKYWVEPAAEDSPRRASRAAKSPSVDEWFYVPTWQRDDRAAGRGAPPPGRVLVFEHQARHDGLKARVLGTGQTPVSVLAGDCFEQHGAESFSIRPGSLADHCELVRRLSASDMLPTRVVHLWTVGVEGFARIDALGFQPLLNLARALDRHANGHEVVLQLATDRLFDVTGAEHALPEKALLLSPGLVIPQEYPNVRCQCVDLGSSLDAANVSLDTLLAEPDGIGFSARVAYRHRARWIEHFRPIELVDDAGALPPGGVYWITGGLGRVGLRVADYIGRRTRAKLVLITRRGLPGHADWHRPALDAGPADHPNVDALAASIRAIEESGSEVWVVRRDVGDLPGMLALGRETAQRFGGVRAIVHAAGEAGERTVKLIGDITEHEIAEQLHAKTLGIQAIAGVSAELRPELCVVMSSNASVLGGIGSIAYTAAHQYQDAFARRHDGVGGTRWLTINWDGWPSLDDGLSVGRLRSSLDQYVMTPHECTRALDRALSSHPVERLVVSTGDLEARLQRWVTRVARPSPSIASPASGGAEPAPGGGAPRNEMERAIAGLWEEVLGVSGIGMTDNFFDLGGNSLMALKIVSALTKQTGRKVALTSIFEGPTPRALAAILSADVEPSAAMEQSQARGESRRRRREQSTAAPEQELA